jgi:hypothetical protein
MWSVLGPGLRWWEWIDIFSAMEIPGLMIELEFFFFLLFMDSGLEGISEQIQ